MYFVFMMYLPQMAYDDFVGQWNNIYYPSNQNSAQDQVVTA